MTWWLHCGRNVERRIADNCKVMPAIRATCSSHNEMQLLSDQVDIYLSLLWVEQHYYQGLDSCDFETTLHVKIASTNIWAEIQEKYSKIETDLHKNSEVNNILVDGIFSLPFFSERKKISREWGIGFGFAANTMTTKFATL